MVRAAVSLTPFTALRGSRMLSLDADLLERVKPVAIRLEMLSADRALLSQRVAQLMKW